MWLLEQWYGGDNDADTRSAWCLRNKPMSHMNFTYSALNDDTFLILDNFIVVYSIMSWLIDGSIMIGLFVFSSTGNLLLLNQALERHQVIRKFLLLWYVGDAGWLPDVRLLWFFQRAINCDIQKTCSCRRHIKLAVISVFIPILPRTLECKLNASLRILNYPLKLTTIATDLYLLRQPSWI